MLQKALQIDKFTDISNSKRGDGDNNDNNSSN